MEHLVRQMAGERKYDLVMLQPERRTLRLQWLEYPECWRSTTSHPLDGRNYRRQTNRAESSQMAHLAKVPPYERRLYPHLMRYHGLGADRQACGGYPAYQGRLEVIPNGVDLETRQTGLAEPARVQWS